MPDFFRGVFDTDLTQVISITDFLLCVGGAPGGRATAGPGLHGGHPVHQKL